MNRISIEECKLIANKLQDIPPPESLGLSGGMMGQCLFYYWMHRKTQIEEYEKMADKLLDEVFNNLDFSQSLTFENGLLGIGWAMNHLLQYEFVEGEADEILEEVDRYTWLYLSQNIYSLELLTSLGLYFTCRYPNEKRYEFTPVQKKMKHNLLTLLLQLNSFIEQTGPNVFVQYAKGFDTSFAANNHLFKSLYVLTQCYKSGVFNYKTAKLIRFF